jgi:hypothetical protein
MIKDDVDLTVKFFQKKPDCIIAQLNLGNLNERLGLNQMI